MENRVSLVIPVKNEEKSIGLLLDSVFDQEVLPAEVVIADSCSEDRTVSTIKEYAARHYPINLIELGDMYPGTARNAAIKVSENELIALTDAGIVLDRSWLRELLDVMESDAGIEAVFGSYEPNRDTMFKRYSSLAFVPPKKDILGNRMRAFFLASMMLKKSLWQELGGFPDLRSAEDRIFMERIAKAGRKIAFAPKALVTWDIPDGPRKLFSRFYLYSYHGIKAARMKDWHLPVGRTYLVFLIFLFLSFSVSPAFFYAAILLFVARASKLIIERCEGGVLQMLNPLQFCIVFFSMVLIDIAMFCGMARYALERVGHGYGHQK